jgi:hypothetical protein
MVMERIAVRIGEKEATTLLCSMEAPRLGRVRGQNRQELLFQLQNTHGNRYVRQKNEQCS